MSYQFTYNTRQAVYLLDRNIISLIRNVNSGKLPTDDNKKLMLEQLKDKDKKENLFSPMTSIAEGNQKRIMNEEEFRTVIDNDAAAIESFFQ
jgi:hypothetical protein